MIKVILFDLDDTLISEDDYIQSGYKHVARVIAKEFGFVEQQVKNQLYALYQNDVKNVFNRFLENKGITYDLSFVKYLVEVYRNHIPDIGFLDDVEETLNALKKQEIKIGIISDGYLVTQHNKAKVLQLYDKVDKVIFTDELGKEFWKPCSKAFEIMKDYFQVDYDEMMYVGDNPQKDFYIKKVLPIKTVRICRKNAIYQNVEYLENIKEDIQINDLTDLLDFL